MRNSAFVVPVDHVFFLGSREQMKRVKAWRIIAGMKDKRFPGRERANEVLVDDAMHGLIAMHDCYVSVALDQAIWPEQTLVGVIGIKMGKDGGDYVCECATVFCAKVLRIGWHLSPPVTRCSGGGDV
jgi:hypothetical protein